MGKVFVCITAEHDSNGNIRPTVLHWEDGRKWPIERLLDIRTAAALKGGGQGIRYRCRIAGKVVDLYCDEGRWFINSEKIV